MNNNLNLCLERGWQLSRQITCKNHWQKKPNHVNTAINKTLEKSYQEAAIVEKFIDGKEYSVDMISHKGWHYCLTITENITTGSPYFVVITHHQPAKITADVQQKITSEVIKGIDVLGLRNCVTHAEVRFVGGHNVFIIEIVKRMGGYFVGSHTVFYSTDYDYLKGNIDVALDGFDPREIKTTKGKHSGVFFVIPFSGRIKEIEDFRDSTKVFLKVRYC